MTNTGKKKTKEGDFIEFKNMWGKRNNNDKQTKVWT